VSGNTRVVGQKELSAFREEMGNKVKDKYSVVMKHKKLPMALLTNPHEVCANLFSNINRYVQNARMNLLTTESFDATFGPKKLRKKPKLAGNDLGSLVTHVQKQAERFSETQSIAASVSSELGMSSSSSSSNSAGSEYKEGVRAKLFEKGQSRRIWGELFKVIDSSDVLIQVLDVRDPMGTRSKRIEDELAKPDRRHKQMVLVLNKCDLVPTWVTKRWVRLLSMEYPTLAFHASITNPFGKGALIQLLRQFGQLHKDKKVCICCINSSWFLCSDQISLGFCS